MDMTPLAARSLAGLLEQATGQQLGTGRRWRIESALQPLMRERGIDNLDVLAGMASQPGSPLRELVVEALLNHETSFYRDIGVYKAFGNDALPAIAALRSETKRLRIWSAGCATGQEVYSLAFLFGDQGSRWDDWMVEILGTDVSPRAIAQARNGSYNQMEVQRGLPITELIKRFDQEGDDWRVRPMLKARASFQVHNLLDPPPAPPYDIIFCRNVLLYLSPERRAQVFDNLFRAMAPQGMLILGAGETVLGQTQAFYPDPVLRGTYRPNRRAIRED